MGSRGFSSAGARPFGLSRGNSETGEILVDHDQLEIQTENENHVQLRNRSFTSSTADSINRSSTNCKNVKHYSYEMSYLSGSLKY